ncbi:plasmid mobilization relaxosome protein MobC, partial [Actibacterium sp.]|uniref:plasmid mobilization relaxosome protein MobC n=1 Tax=Actibacterium sp. TaxID=1872125 RepID=UPI003569663E
MTKRPNGKRESPLSIRLTFEERARLDSQAGNLPLGSYIKSQLFTDEAETYRKRRRAPQVDEKLLAEVLACLGASRIANNLNQLAKAANTGSLIVDPDTKRDLKRASDDIHAMRMLLMQAL